MRTFGVGTTVRLAMPSRIAAKTGVARERILVGCIHTHSGPDTGLGALLRSSEPGVYQTKIVVGLGQFPVATLNPANQRQIVLRLQNPGIQALIQFILDRGFVFRIQIR